MKNLGRSTKGGTQTRSSSRKTTADLLRLICHRLMSPQGGHHASFCRVSLEGSNVGSAMTIRRAGDSKGPPDSCSINVYVSNNVQGVNNSILVGSKVLMGDPGVGVSLRRKKRPKKVNPGAFLGSWWFVGFVFFLGVVVLLFLLG